MARTTDELAAIARTLNTVESAGETRAAIGAALNALSRAYPLLDSFGAFQGELSSTYRRQLDSARTALEAWYRSMPATSDGGMQYTATWQQKRRLVDTAYNVIAGLEGAVDFEPSTSNWSILSDAVSNAPGVFLASVGQAAGAIAKEAGSAAGSAVGGVLSGLGVSGVTTLVIIGAVVLVYLNRATLLGKVLA